MVKCSRQKASLLRQSNLSEGCHYGTLYFSQRRITMIEFVLHLLVLFLIIDITRRTKDLIDESIEDEDGEVVGRSTPISRRAYDKIG